MGRLPGGKMVVMADGSKKYHSAAQLAMIGVDTTPVAMAKEGKTRAVQVHSAGTIAGVEKSTGLRHEGFIIEPGTAIAIPVFLRADHGVDTVKAIMARLRMGE